MIHDDLLTEIGLRLLTKGWAVPRHLIWADWSVRQSMPFCSKYSIVQLEIQFILQYLLALVRHFYCTGYLSFSIPKYVNASNSMAHCFGIISINAFVKQMEHCNPT